MTHSQTTRAARVFWTSAEVRGRSSPPATLRYVGLSRFSADGPGWPDGAWSVELYFDVPPPEQQDAGVSEARVRFLMEDAPTERLSVGQRFSLYEGPFRVADVEVVG